MPNKTANIFNCLKGNFLINISTISGQFNIVLYIQMKGTQRCKVNLLVQGSFNSNIVMSSLSFNQEILKNSMPIRYFCGCGGKSVLEYGE